MRIAVAGMVGTFPIGGPFWDYIQFVQGFHQLGHDILYIEDTAQWFYSPELQTYTPDGSHNAKFIASHMERLDPALATKWFLRDADNKTFGVAPQSAAEFCKTADIFINLSAACYMRDEYRSAQRVVFIDSDPMYTQAGFPDYLAGTADERHRARIHSIVENHDVFMTFGENIGRADCQVPLGLVDWIPTRQPVVMNALAPFSVPVEQRRRAFTTIGSWEPAKKPGVLVGNRTYYGKSVELLRFQSLAQKSPVPIELAMGGECPRQEFEAQEWKFADAGEVSRDPWVYRDYLASSFGEWSVAKNAYVDGRTGWFSCRTACYLALGVPAVVQDTGFTKFVPTGRGLFAFSTEEEALHGIEEIAANPMTHARAATEVAHCTFGSDLVLSRLIEQAFAARKRT